MQLKFNPHPAQDRLLRAEARIYCAISGIQGGKTSLGVYWLTQKLEGVASNVNFLVAAPTYKILQQSTLPAIMSIWPPWFYTYNKNDATLTLKTGNKIYLRTGTDPNAAEGIQLIGAAWLDEAGMCSRMFWHNVESRTAFMQASVLLTSTPYGMNWLKKEVIDAAKHREDICYVHWRSVDNPAFPKEEYERQKQMLPPSVFRRKYEGIHEQMEGLVYNLTPSHKCKPFELPQGTKYYAGVDWGYHNPMGIIIRAITPNGHHYTVSEFKKSGLTPDEKVQAAKAKHGIYNCERFLCDPEDPAMIETFVRAGLPAVAFHKLYTQGKEISPGIELHASLIHQNRFQIFEGCCPELEDEYSTYHYAESKENREAKEIPVATNNHLMDA